MRGLFIPSTTSNHQFFVKADSEVRFLFNPNGNDASGAVSNQKAHSALGKKDGAKSFKTFNFSETFLIYCYIIFVSCIVERYSNFDVL